MSFSILLRLTMVLVLTQSAAAGDSDLLTQLSARLAFHEDIDGEFRQQKHLDFMNTPFVSNGVFSMGKDNGLYWHVLTPVDSLMTVTENEVVLDGRRVKDRGVGRLMAQIMRSFMNGDMARLSKDFNTQGDIEEDHWSLRLIPTGATLSQVLTHIQVTGESQLETIEVVEHSGTRTLITFHNLSAVTN